jgi:hypothetical protein
MKILIEQISMWGSIIGTTLLALHLPYSGIAFIILLLSNFATIYILRGTNVPKVLWYQTGYFVIINLVGIVRWLL